MDDIFFIGRLIY